MMHYSGSDWLTAKTTAPQKLSSVAASTCQEELPPLLYKRVIMGRERQMFNNMRVATQPGCVRVFAVIVLYKIPPQQSVSWVSLQAALEAVPAGTLQFKVLLYDNTPGGQDPGVLPSGVQYQAASHNGGLAEAYNQALQFAEAEGYHWLLTLDQDTTLPPTFLTRISQIAREVENTPSIAAIVPQIMGGGRMLSPYWFSLGTIARWFNKGFTGIPSQPAFAFNSASTLRVTALCQIGGYDPWFWLDNSDAYMYRKLHRHGKRVFVAGDIEVAHDFSMMDMQSRVSPSRYRNILLAESAFWDLEMGTLAGLERTVRLVLRIYKHFRRNDSPDFRINTYAFLWRRLFWTRRRRIRAWETETRKMFPQLPENRSRAFHEGVFSRRSLKLSVCMAAYNGEQYVVEQIQSILHQLHEQDELVIVDDASTDRTRDRIKAFCDSRVRLIEHSSNCGVVATFEDAIRNATGDILFLADDDDIWAPNKVEKVIETFEKHPDAQIVTSEVSIIDELGCPSSDTRLSDRTTFRSEFWKNILWNHFQGSAMAIRSSLLNSVLPFPKHVGFLHDQWIGTRNALSGKSAVFIHAPLLFYRRHSQNFSKKMHRSRQIKVRLQLLWTHFFRCLVNGKN